MRASFPALPFSPSLNPYSPYPLLLLPCSPSSSPLPPQASSCNLREMLDLASEQLGELEAEREGERVHLAELRGGGRLTTQAQLDAAQAELREAGQEAEVARCKHDQVHVVG